MLDKKLFENFPEDSQVWIYQSNREMSSTEIKEIREKMSAFATGWSNHGNPLKGAIEVIKPFFLISTVDPTVLKASGCSVDDFNNHLKDVTENMNIDFFDRMILTIQVEGETKQISFTELANYENALLFDPLVSSLKELKNNWPLPIRESHFASVLLNKV